MTTELKDEYPSNEELDAAAIRQILPILLHQLAIGRKTLIDADSNCEAAIERGLDGPQEIAQAKSILASMRAREILQECLAFTDAMRAASLPVKPRAKAH